VAEWRWVANADAAAAATKCQERIKCRHYRHRWSGFMGAMGWDGALEFGGGLISNGS